jgi:glycosyltransferase involved in cell wall biosynthesis
MMFPEERLALALMDDPRIGGLLIADSYRSRAAAIARRSRGLGSGMPRRPGLHHARPLRLRRGDPVSTKRLREAARRYAWRLERASERAGLVRPAVVMCNPLVAAFGDFGWAGTRTYYGWDCWLEHYGEAARRDAYADAYRILREDRWRVAAVSEPIIERIAPSGPAIVVPNGITPDEWLDVPPPPRWFAELPHPRLLYVGSLDRRLDVELVRSAAQRFAGGSIVLIGVNYDPRHLAPLDAFANVHIVPPVGRAHVPAITVASDVALVPHVRSPLTEAMSPLKLYEGLAGGRPVAAVDIEPMRGIDDRVVLAGTAADWVGTVEAALALGPAPEPERRAFLTANSWERRFRDVIDLALAEERRS